MLYSDFLKYFLAAYNWYFVYYKLKEYDLPPNVGSGLQLTGKACNKTPNALCWQQQGVKVKVWPNTNMMLRVG